MASSQWEQVLELGLFGEVWNFYKNQQFPISVRIRLNPGWLEFQVNQLRLTANPTNPDDIPFFDNFLVGFVKDLRTSANAILESAKLNQDNPGIAMGYELQQETDELAARFQENPVGLFYTIKICLDYELDMILEKTGCKQANHGANEPLVVQQPLSIVSRYSNLDSRLHKVVLHTAEINRIRLQMQDTIVELAQLGMDLNELQVDIQVASACRPQNGELPIELHALETTYRQKQSHWAEKVASLKRDVTNFTSHIKNAIDTLKLLAEELLQLIDEWKMDQRRSANGFPMTHSLDRISSLAKTLVSGVVELNSQLQCKVRIENCLLENGEPIEAVTQMVNGFKADLDNLLYFMVFNTFMVETQPPQILRLKSAIKQGIKIQLLVGSTLIPNSTPVVKAMLIDKDEAEQLHQNKMYMPKPSIKLTHNEMEMRNDKDKFGTTFSGITLPDKRKDPALKCKGQKDSDDQFVTRKKYCFYFYTTFSAPDMPSFTIWTTSLPCIITCHPSQDPDAWATILWDNAFALADRKPFEVPKEVDSKNLIEVLSHVFKLQTRRQLSESHKQFLLKKLMGEQVGPATWHLFFEKKIECAISKRPNPDNPKPKEEPRVYFHSWLFNIKRLCESASKDDNEDMSYEPKPKTNSRNHKKPPKDSTTIPSHWASELIEGFIAREHLHERLRVKPAGTFLLYFSEAILGGLTVAWFNHKEGKVEKFAPYEAKELKDHPLEERILSSDHLQFLYPNTHKETAFHVLRDSKELIDFKWDMMKKGYIWHTQQQVPQPTKSGNDRQISGSSPNASLYSSCDSPYSYGYPLSVSPLSISSPQSAYDITSSATHCLYNNVGPSFQ